MTANRTRLHPDLPVCWEDPDTLRIGFERALARVRFPSAGAQRFIGLLAEGIEEDRLPGAARRAGITMREAHALLADLGPALIVERVPARAGTGVRVGGRSGVRGSAAADATAAASASASASASGTVASGGSAAGTVASGQATRAGMPRLRVALCDDGRDVPGLRDALLASDLCRLDLARGETPELVLYVERYLEPLERAQRWLMAGLPQLLLRFTDGGVHVGPLISPAGAPCHTCLALALVAADPAAPALAAQLSGRRPRSETAAVAQLAAACAAVFVRRWRAEDPGVHVTGVRVPVDDGLPSGLPEARTVEPHPECACGLGADPPPRRRPAPVPEREPVGGR
ncbi:hypothetical protein MUN77_09045 [Leucobacter allii]|uniref:hypothetical protein n=1 Tax=Leucobacter allii TaxID=2932247 RepID=UPI001FD45657|nr:hypothetical protein [Leucobacter allii]UOR00325.1 hypothetical protein MUN77_09045 [Leucobacter allii]